MARAGSSAGTIPTVSVFIIAPGCGHFKVAGTHRAPQNRTCIGIMPLTRNEILRPTSAPPRATGRPWAAGATGAMPCHPSLCRRPGAALTQSQREIDPLRPFGEIDERIAVALPLLDGQIAVPLILRRRELFVPGEQGVDAVGRVFGGGGIDLARIAQQEVCLLYTSPSPRD